MTPVAGVVAGVDVGNHTTEIVLARVDAGIVEQLAHGQGPTRGRKGSPDSLQGAAADSSDKIGMSGVMALSPSMMTRCDSKSASVNGELSSLRCTANLPS